MSAKNIYVSTSANWICIFVIDRPIQQNRISSEAYANTHLSMHITSIATSPGHRVVHDYICPSVRGSHKSIAAMPRPHRAFIYSSSRLCDDILDSGGNRNHTVGNIKKNSRFHQLKRAFVGFRTKRRKKREIWR